MPPIESDDTPFNPFYIGPHPSKACAVPEVPGQQCSPPCQDCKEDSPKQAAGPAAGTAADPAAAASNPVGGPQGMAGALVIVGMAGPSGGVAAIYSTTETVASSAKAAESSTDNPCAGKKIECMQGGKTDKASE